MSENIVNTQQKFAEFFKIDGRLKDTSKQAELRIKPELEKLDEIIEFNQQKVLSAFIGNNISELHFVPTTGYGYGDRGREVLDEVYAEIFGFGAEYEADALVRHSIVSGTHAIGIALYATLRPGDMLLGITGTPYDTLHKVIGKEGDGDTGSLYNLGVKYAEVALGADEKPNRDEIIRALKNYQPRVVHIQRSRGYNTRPSLTIAEIGELVKLVREFSEKSIVFVDNCYGEFVERLEPPAVGADLIAGSLIKNPGGGIAENGGYICGRKELIELCANRMTSPGLGREVGATLGHSRLMYMGLFSAPHVVGEALKTAIYCAALFSLLGYEVSPSFDEYRTDIIQTVKLRTPEGVIAFCQGMQTGAPIDSFVVPEAWEMPGYENPVIMAAGAFTAGASIELSADAPLREPFAAYMQGGLNFHSGKTGVLLAAQKMLEKGFLSL